MGLGGLEAPNDLSWSLSGGAEAQLDALVGEAKYSEKDLSTEEGLEAAMEQEVKMDPWVLKEFDVNDKTAAVNKMRDRLLARYEVKE